MIMDLELSSRKDSGNRWMCWGRKGLKQRNEAPKNPKFEKSQRIAKPFCGRVGGDYSTPTIDIDSS
jgi:hypothetical protein